LFSDFPNFGRQSIIKASATKLVEVINERFAKDR
jgi:hypothetical protein